MSKNIFSAILVSAVFAMSSVPAWAVGSVAYRLEVADATAAGMGSAFVGEADSPAAVYYNPAGMTHVDGNALSIGASLIQPFGDVDRSSGTDQMQRHNFLVPSAFFVTDLGTEKFAFGLGTTSSWGLGTEWHADSFARYAATKSTIEMKDYLITGAYQMTEKFSLGLGLDIDDAMVDKHKKLYQAGMGDGDFRLKATDTSVGFRVAGMYKVNERHQFGAMYRSAIDHKYRGTVMTSNLGNDGVNNYQAVFGGTSYQTDVEAKATLPQGILLGYSYRPNEKWTMNLDLEWTDWSSTKDEVLTYPTETNAVRLAYLQNGVATPRDWDSVLSVGAGAEYALSETWRVRGGGFYRQGPVPGDTWEPNLPDADNFGIALGTGMNLTKSLVLDLAWSMIQYKDRVVDNTVNDTYGGIDGTYKNSANLLYATLTWEF